MKEFHHKSCIMMIKVDEKLLEKMKSKKVKFMILRTVAKLLLKTSRRSDLIAIYDETIFSILMRHTSLQNAKQAAERLNGIICDTNFFVKESEINLNVNIGIAQISLERSIESTLTCAIDAISLGEKDNLPYGICPQDDED